MRDHENIMNVAEVAPDFMGFIFYPLSPRYVGTDFTIPPDFPSDMRVGVFVNESVESILFQAERHDLDFVQLHGSETVKECWEIKRHNIKIIKAFAIDTFFDFEVPKFYLDDVDYFLFDTKGKKPGGNAETFDWSLLDQYRDEKPYFLSGGISPENVAEAVSINDPRLVALDVNSGVELHPGVKDPGKIKRVKDVLNQQKL